METKDRGSLAEEMMEDALLLEELRPARRRQLYLMVKRAQDLFLSLLALVVLSPVLLLIALAVVIDDPRGGPLFTQTRCGQWGKEFRLYKFRTMYIDAEERLEELLPYNEMTGPAFKIRNDPRVTRFGRLLRSMGLDELPQLLNILWGDMSIVGPRPPLPREKADNFIQIELERYEAFALENGLSREQNTFQSRMQYANRLLDTERQKDMAAYDVRLEAIEMYNAFMTRFVLIPTYDTDKEFYMSRTKVGVDYFAAEAKEHLASAAQLGEEMEHNDYASRQTGSAPAFSTARSQANHRIEELKTELLVLSDQCRELCGAYVREKRDGYIQVCYPSPSLGTIGAVSLLMAALFTAALAGSLLLQRERRSPLPQAGAGKTEKRQEVAP